MKVKISAQHFSLHESVKSYAEEKIKEIVGKYFQKAICSDVHFTRQSYIYICDIVVHEGSGLHVIIKSSAECDDVYSAFDQASAKIAKQLRKYKSKIKDHHNEKASIAYAEATKYIIDPYQDEQEGSGPVTIAEKPVRIGTFTVAEAIMRMDLDDLPALMFKNKATNRMNIVYYRKDGNIAWVDSSEK
ncbi:MAG: ribosome-associated translation inhibitor RaiA [Rickettsiaceae bacterium]|nr:ribosome-associated translation inhibitor RaiA [Rickettsiaceae bacterium]